MPKLSAQKVIVADLSRQNTVQLAQLNQDWQKLRQSRGKLATTVRIAFAATSLAPLLSHLYQLITNPTPSRWRYLRGLLRKFFKPNHR